ncbi:MAG: clan AA aspartic protease [SAR324 cluster bacterium]|nr:clan AA aspartic protease [SAR324 cluster bacterium]
MGLVYADIEIVRGADLVLVEEGLLSPKKVRKMKVKALVDSGAYMLALNEDIRTQLDLRKVDEQFAELADGTRICLDVVVPVEVRFQNRSTTVRAMVLPRDSEVLLGAIPMEDMDVLIDPRQQKLVVNPENPYVVKKPLK